MDQPHSTTARLRSAAAEHANLLQLGLFGSLTLGLAPFVPHPHIYKQLQNIARGTLTQPIDVFDLVMHGAPWIVLAYALARVAVTALGSAPDRSPRPDETSGS